MPKKKKYLASYRNLNQHSSLLFNDIENNFFFAHPEDDKAALISPYCIVTDGHDVCRFIHKDTGGSNGFFCMTGKNRNKKFKDIIEEEIKKAFFGLFSKINLNNNEISVCETRKAIYLIFQQELRIVPIYFVILTNQKAINMKLKEEKVISIVQVGLNECFQETNGQFLDGVVCHLIKTGDIQLPSFSYPSKFSEI